MALLGKMMEAEARPEAKRGKNGKPLPVSELA
jgi:hypothetical protein